MLSFPLPSTSGANFPYTCTESAGADRYLRLLMKLCQGGETKSKVVEVPDAVTIDSIGMAPVRAKLSRQFAATLSRGKALDAAVEQGPVANVEALVIPK